MSISNALLIILTRVGKVEPVRVTYYAVTCVCSCLVRYVIRIISEHISCRQYPTQSPTNNYWDEDLESRHVLWVNKLAANICNICSLSSHRSFLLGQCWQRISDFFYKKPYLRTVYIAWMYSWIFVFKSLLMSFLNIKYVKHTIFCKKGDSFKPKVLPVLELTGGVRDTHLKHRQNCIFRNYRHFDTHINWQIHAYIVEILNFENSAWYLSVILHILSDKHCFIVFWTALLSTISAQI